MVITIVRSSFTRDVTRGIMTTDGFPEMRTLESALPRNLDNYVGHALPPGNYRCHVEYCPVTYKGTYLRLHWIVIDAVPWFPRATVIQDNDGSTTPKKGEIFIGTDYADNGFTVVNPDNDAMKYWARLSRQAAESGEDITLRIVNADDITFTDTYRDKARQEAAEREQQAHRERLMQELLDV